MTTNAKREAALKLEMIGYSEAWRAERDFAPRRDVRAIEERWFRIARQIKGTNNVSR